MARQIRVAVLIEEAYQDLEVWYPILRLREEGFHVVSVEPNGRKEYKGKFGYPIDVDKKIDQVEVADFEGVVIPGGWAPDRMRLSKKMVDFVRDMNKKGKVIASICHGGWMLASAGICKGRTMTSYIAIKDDLVNAGAKFVDAEVVVDRNLITSRKPSDLPAFMKAMIKALKK